MLPPLDAVDSVEAPDLASNVGNSMGRSGGSSSGGDD